MSDSTKILILVSTVIIVCVLCAVGFKMVNEGKSSVNSSTNNFNNMISQYSDIDLAIYDSANVQGSEVVNLIRTAIESEKYLSIRVKTKAASSYENYNYVIKNLETNPENPENPELGEKADVQLTNEKSEPEYINPTAQFTGKVYKDANGIIICIEFTQI